MSKHVLDCWPFYLAVAAFALLILGGISPLEAAGLSFLLFLALIVLAVVTKLIGVTIMYAVRESRERKRMGIVAGPTPWCDYVDVIGRPLPQPPAESTPAITALDRRVIG